MMMLVEQQTTAARPTSSLDIIKVKLMLVEQQTTAGLDQIQSLYSPGKRTILFT